MYLLVKRLQYIYFSYKYISKEAVISFVCVTLATIFWSFLPNINHQDSDVYYRNKVVNSKR